MITTSKQITKHFHSTEFKCQHCNKIYIQEELVNKLERLIELLGASKCIISSGYRCETYDKKIGGFVGKHAQGIAADCCFYDKNNNIIPSKNVICVAWSNKLLNGIAKINNNYVHLDNRVGSTYYGDETKSNNSCWTDPYTYFGVARPTSTIKYQSHGLGISWYPNVTKGSNNYAGVFGIAMDGLYIDNLEYRVKVGGKWLPAVNGRNDYAGILGKPITDVAIKGATYRVHNKTTNKWLGWISSYDINNKISGYAGNGSVIDAIQIR